MIYISTFKNSIWWVQDEDSNILLADTEKHKLDKAEVWLMF